MDWRRIMSLLRVLVSLAILTAFASAQPALAGDGGFHEIALRPDGTPAAGPLSAERQGRLAQKQAMSDLFAGLREGSVPQAAYDAALARFEVNFGRSPLRAQAASNDIHRVGSPSVMAYPSQLYLCALNQVPQAEDYYCGPASAYSVLGALGNWTSYNNESLDQYTLANTVYLETDAHGETPWSTCPGCRPMPESINFWRGGSYSGYYEAVGLPDSVDATTYMNNLQYDIYYGYPVVGNAWERVDQAHLAGHPPSLDIKHWVPVYGYSNYGATTAYADPVNGTSFWTWSPNVPRYSYIDSATLANAMLNGRGYVW